MRIWIYQKKRQDSKKQNTQFSQKLKPELMTRLRTQENN